MYGMVYGIHLPSTKCRQMCVKFPLKDVVFFGKKHTSRHGDGQKWPPPAPAFSKGCGASDHVVDFGTNGWVPRTDGGVGVGSGSGWVLVFWGHPSTQKTEPRPPKKNTKRGPCDLTWNTACLMPGFLFFHVFFLIIPNSSTVVGGHPLKKTQNNETCFFSPWLGWKFWIRVKYIQFFGPQNLKYLKKKSLTIQVCTTLVSKQRLPWKSLWPWKS